MSWRWRSQQQREAEETIYKYANAIHCGTLRAKEACFLIKAGRPEDLDKLRWFQGKDSPSLLRDFYG